MDKFSPLMTAVFFVALLAVVVGATALDRRAERKRRKG
jgi:hypothetical protein